MVKGIDIGTTGAKQTSWEPHSFRALVARLVKENPDEDDEALFHMFAAECAPYFMEIARYAFANALKALSPRSRGSSVDRSVARAKAIEKYSSRVLLDFMMPNGKMLRDTTFGECANAGGWLTRLSKKGRPGDKVGAVLTEKEVQAVYKA